MKQITFLDEQATSTKYAKSAGGPIYQPTGRNYGPHELRDTTVRDRLRAEVDASTLPADIKAFLRDAAERHTVFNYERIADFYACADPDTQRLMERSALVIVDIDQAIELGYVRLCDKVRRLYLEEKR